MKRPRAGWIVAGLLSALFIAVGWSRLQFDVDVLNLLPADLPEVQGLRLHQRHFADADNLLVTLEAPSAEAAETATRQLAKALHAATNLVAEVVWQAPFRARPAEVGPFLAWLWLNQPPEAVRQLAARLAPESVTTQLARALDTLTASLSPLEIARLSRDPLELTRLPAADGLLEPGRAGDEWFRSADGRFRVLHVHPALPSRNYRECAAWLEQLRDRAAQLRSSRDWPAGTELAFTGAPAFLAETATGMERDLRRATTGAFLLIALLFWLTYRQWRPLLGVALGLAVVLLLTTAAGGLIFGRLNAVSLGFAAILLGLGVDYALVLYQELRVGGSPDAGRVRRAVGPAIAWAALTTAAAFALLNFAGLPGLQQLGTLVAVGILLAAGLMVWGFLPAMARAEPRAPASTARRRASPSPQASSGGGSIRRTLLGTALLLLCTGAVVTWRPPRLDASTQPLGPSHSAADAALRRLQQRLEHNPDRLWLLVRGDDLQDTADRLATVERQLAQAKKARAIAGFDLPLTLWPRPAWQAVNRQTLRGVLVQRPHLETAVNEAGFTPEAWELTDTVFREWERLLANEAPAWPTGHDAAWLFRRFAAGDETGWIALGRVEASGSPLAAADALRTRWREDQVLVTGWTLLGQALLRRVEERVGWLSGGIAAVVGLCLMAAFRQGREVLLVGAACAVAGLGLQAVMSLAGWAWNLLNLAALPLLLGVGVDYGIHVLMNLRRHGGRRDRLWRTTGRALLLCGATTIAGFGSLAWSGNAGLAGLGRVCATGVACVLVAALYFLPRWRYALLTDTARPPETNHDRSPDRRAG